MARVQNLQCDGCLQVLYGADRAAFIRGKQYFTFKGQIKMQMFDDESQQQYFFYIGWPESEFAFHLPSDKDCFEEFIQAETARYHDRRRGQLMAEVGQYGGSDYVPTKPFIDRRNPGQTRVAQGGRPAPAPAPFDPTQKPNHFGYGGSV